MFPSNVVEALALLYVQNFDWYEDTPEHLVEEYIKAEKVIEKKLIEAGLVHQKQI